MSRVDVPWYVAAGWAIDLFLGQQQRHHDDLEVGVPADRFPEVADALSSYDLFVAAGINDKPLVWPLGAAEWSLEHHQTWVREPSTGYWRMDLFREPSRDGLWVCRRHPDIALAYEDVIAHTADGIPFARPEVVLLFKAKHQLPKDEADFAAALPFLNPDARSRLAAWLELVHPGHSWISALR